MDLSQIKTLLHQKGLIPAGDIECIPLRGGVSSEIYLLRGGAERLVVKRALPCLKVRETWKADTSRNRVEQASINYVGRLNPGVVPKILYSTPGEDFFVMEYLGSEYRNWKVQLLEGHFDQAVSARIAKILADIHSRSYGDETARKWFDTPDNFHSLRIEPYLLTTAERNPHVRDLMLQEAERLAKQRLCLVHGDFSPKNIMVGPERTVLLDHEVAWYGDPAFDLAFMLTHLHLKQFMLGPSFEGYPDLARVFWHTYFENFIPGPGDLKERSLRLWLMVLLARIDGKSPVEYLAENVNARQFIRSFANKALLEGHFTRDVLEEQWTLALKNYYQHEN